MRVLAIAFLVFSALGLAAQPAPNNEKRQLIVLLQASIDSFTAKVNPLTEAQFFKQPNDTTWSVAQITEHLSQIEEGYLREYFVAINTPPPAASVILKKATDADLTAYETNSVKTKARGTNLPLGRYKSKKDALTILTAVRGETIAVISSAENLRNTYSYRKKGENTYEAKDMYQHFLLLIAHMKRHTRQAEKIIARL
ncbi:MAG: DinB family protein [Niabella sp.]